MADPPCSVVSATLDEPVFGTASIVHAWLLVEQPGSWGRDALFESRLPVSVARALVRQADRHHVRLLLIRRPDRTRVTGGRHCFAVSSRRPAPPPSEPATAPPHLAPATAPRHLAPATAPWIEQRRFDDPTELLDVDFAALGAGERSFGPGAGHNEPLYLVCTNGRHDPCCAQFGRPVLRALASPRVWESSHLGGERFAGNLVCLPHGVYYGRVDPSTAPAIADQYAQGRVDLDHYRGRAGDAFVVQAAEFYLRRAEGLLGVDDVTPLRRTSLGNGLVAVELATADGRRFEAHVALRPGDPARPLTCTATTARRPPAFALVDLFPLPPPGPAVQ